MTFDLRSEFAHVRVSLDLDANGPRLAIEDVKTGKAVYLDPLELEGLAWADHVELTPFVNPSFRWVEKGPMLNRDLRRLGISE